MKKLPIRLFAIAAAMLLFIAASGVMAAAPEEESLDRLLPLVGGALVDAGKGQWSDAAEEVKLFEKAWQEIGNSSTKSSDRVNEALETAKKAIGAADAKPEEAYQAVSGLTSAVRDYVNEVKPKENTTEAAKQAVVKLVPVLKQTIVKAEKADWPAAQDSYKQFVNQWGKIEGKVRTSDSRAYANIETKLSFARIALQAEPPREEAAVSGLQALADAIQQFIDGKAESASAATDSVSIGDMLILINQAETAIDAGQSDRALTVMQTFIAQWPSAEGAVSTRSQSDYNKIESEMTKASSYLLSSPPKTEQALASMNVLRMTLEPYTSASSYSAWDAAAILLREGVETLLVVTALLAFLQRSGNGDNQKWIWGGAITGLVVSIGFAILLTYVIAAVSAGTTREMLEGYIGLASVVMMLGVAIWLHSKANVQGWNQYIRKQTGSALESGKLWYLFAIAGLAILREGAETAIFYIGMAPAIEWSQLLIGTGAAALILAVLGIVIIRSSARLPIRPFLLVATLLIYYLVFKFMGQSLHSLQISGQLPTHVLDSMPTITWLGFYSTWETIIPQLIVVVIIILQVVLIERKKRPNIAV
ncbi:FTR1 family iron permease [Paenibacillus spongiae]|uniref:FTR1 family protein n=1 Tax=Paenibacillus spongiae TaxID=2909671 RepID=A0ABY5SI69_9BACL|nr:FTR1 family protein [Paenibacillus spongiae]UVI33263.1 FTR1 family protein [Paenibacillus spongiae]